MIQNAAAHLCITYPSSTRVTFAYRVVNAAAPSYLSRSVTVPSGSYTTKQKIPRSQLSESISMDYLCTLSVTHDTHKKEELEDESLQFPAILHLTTCGTYCLMADLVVPYM